MSRRPRSSSATQTRTIRSSISAPSRDVREVPSLPDDSGLGSDRIVTNVNDENTISIGPFGSDTGSDANRTTTWPKNEM